MDYKDLKKLALLGIIGGMMIGAPGYAEEHEDAEEPPVEENGGENGEMSCSGPGGCAGKE